MKVQAASPRAKSQQMVVEMLLAGHAGCGLPMERWGGKLRIDSWGAYPSSAGAHSIKTAEAVGQHGELSQWADRLGVSTCARLKGPWRREQPA